MAGEPIVNVECSIMNVDTASSSKRALKNLALQFNLDLIDN
jgi:hypothetical protein